jgi:hypothetical protein
MFKENLIVTFSKKKLYSFHHLALQLVEVIIQNVSLCVIIQHDIHCNLISTVKSTCQVSGYQALQIIHLKLHQEATHGGKTIQGAILKSVIIRKLR